VSAVSRIRPAHGEDALDLARIHVEAWQATYPGLLPDDYLSALSVSDEAIAWTRRLGQPARDQVLVVELEGRVRGFALAGPARGRPFGIAGEIYALYVDIDWQNRGLGRALLGAALASLRDAGMGGALAWVLGGNPSRYFYEALGGRLLGERQERFAGALLPEVAYGWSDIAAWLARKREG
jgi:GNAT superfamily N-acetyltransferase